MAQPAQTNSVKATVKRGIKMYSRIWICIKMKSRVRINSKDSIYSHSNTLLKTTVYCTLLKHHHFPQNRSLPLLGTLCIPTINLPATEPSGLRPFTPMFLIRITLMRIRILLSTLMLIQIQIQILLFPLMRIRIQLS